MKGYVLYYCSIMAADKIIEKIFKSRKEAQAYLDKEYPDNREYSELFPGYGWDIIEMEVVE